MVTAQLTQCGVGFRLHGPSALDRYFRLPPTDYTFLHTEADVVTLASLFDDLLFPGIDGIDAVVVYNGHEYWFVASDWLAHPWMAFSYDTQRDAYDDPAGVYRTLRDHTTGKPATLPPGSNAAFSAILSARYGFRATYAPGRTGAVWNDRLFRMVLNQVLTGDDVEAGLDVLDRSGVLSLHLEELSSMKETDHSKEGHPEGDVWRHTMETFRYRKDRDYLVALALLLHDVGKPQAIENDGRRFDRHADIGARLATRMAERIGSNRATVESVRWLVRNHMIPGALDRLPPYRRNPIMSSPLFPRLLEVYRCDLCSTYRGPDGYYRACRVYRRFLKDSANPFRDSLGKKLVRVYVE